MEDEISVFGFFGFTFDTFVTVLSVNFNKFHLKKYCFANSFV